MNYEKAYGSVQVNMAGAILEDGWTIEFFWGEQKHLVYRRGVKESVTLVAGMLNFALHEASV